MLAKEADCAEIDEPTYNAPAIPTPPSTTKAPEVVLVEAVVALILTVVILVATSILSVSTANACVPLVTKFNVSSEAPGVVSAVINVKPSTDLTPPSEPQLVPE